MKAVILAAGKGTRMRPLTEDTPKPLLPVAGKPVIQHVIDEVEPLVEEIIVVAGYRKQQVEEYFSGSDIQVVEQPEPLGTADAALKARESVDGRTLVINGDDIHRLPREKLEDVETGIGVKEVENPGDFGVVHQEDGSLEKIVEKPEEPVSSLVSAGFYVVEEDFFELLEAVEKSERGEYEITDAVEKYLEEREMDVIETGEWLPCSYPSQLVEANKKLLEDCGRELRGEVSPEAEITGPVVLEEGAEVREFSTVEGPAIIKSGATVGPGAFIRPGTVLHENVEIGRSEVKNSVLLENAAAKHFNYIGDSYIGRDVNLGAGTKTANVRNDSSTVKTRVKGETFDTGRQKFGAVIASGAKIGVNCSINPGTKIGKDALTDSHEKINRDLPAESLLKDGEIIEDRR